MKNRHNFTNFHITCNFSFHAKQCWLLIHSVQDFSACIVSMAVRDIADHSGENTYSAVDQKRRRIWVSFNLHSLMRNYPSFNDEPRANLNWLEITHFYRVTLKFR